MADQKNRGGQKQGKTQPAQSEQKQGVREKETGGRTDNEKRKDQMTGGRRATTGNK